MHEITSEAGGFSVGLLTEDELLMQRVGLAVGRERLVVASDPATSLDMVASDVHAVRVVDTMALAHLLPDLAKLHSATGSEAGLELWVGAPSRAFPGGRPFSIHAYSRASVDAALAHLQGLLPETGADRAPHERILGETSRIRLIREQVENLSRYRDVSVLVLGETGTGKELVAEALHGLTFGSDRPFVAINCAAIPESLFESELFGHEAGAYTGARGVRVGLMEAAAGGTLFLDEVGEMLASLQPKLLRVLETRTFRRVGSNRDVKLSARVVSATNRLPSRTEVSRLRPDLYYRLAGFSLVLPPVRERLDDVELLATAFLRAFAHYYRLPGLRFGGDTAAALRAHGWPGNVRELRSVVEQAAILAQHGVVGADEIERVLQHQPSAEASDIEQPNRNIVSPLPASPESEPVSRRLLRGSKGLEPTSLRELEQQIVIQSFVDSKGNLSRASKALGLPRSTLRAKLHRWGVV
jgi:DNA-binding NtrC family response regulator